MPFAESSGRVRIHYEKLDAKPKDLPGASDATGATGAIEGDRERTWATLPTSSSPIVMLQGIGLSSAFWFGFPKRLAEDPNNPRTVIVVDSRGTGQSDKPRGAYHMRDLAADVVAVLDAENIPHATLIGMSFGGMIAQQVAVRYRNRVDGLVLLASTPGLPHATLPTLRAILTLAGVGTGRLSPEKALSYLLLPEKDWAKTRTLLAPWEDAAKINPTPPYAFLAQLAAVFTHSVGFSLPKLNCPTVIVAGMEDRLISPKNSETLARLLRKRHLEILPEMGHDIPVLDADVLHRSLAALDRLRGGEVAVEAPAIAQSSKVRLLAVSALREMLAAAASHVGRVGRGFVERLA